MNHNHAGLDPTIEIVILHRLCYICELWDRKKLGFVK